MIIRVLAGLKKTIEDTRESCNAEIKDLKSSQAEIKNAVIKTQFQVETIKMRTGESLDWICDIEDKKLENEEAEKKKKTGNGSQR